MTYSIFYDAGSPRATKEGLTRVETFVTEHEALNRACRLLDDGEHHAISV